MTSTTLSRSTARRSTPRYSALLAATVAAGLLLAACGSSGAPVATSAPTSTSTSTSAQPPAASPSASARSTPHASPTANGIPALSGGPTGPAHADAPAPVSSPPTRVRIPAIGVDSALQALGLAQNGTLETPSAWQVAGWYAGGVRPGDIGPAVIAGHVDSVSGPAVFFKLDKLKPGDAVYVTRANGSTVRFTVDSTAEYPKRTFPTEAVYGPSPVPTLRLVTCTGDFDYAARSYVDNLVVTAYAD